MAGRSDCQETTLNGRLLVEPVGNPTVGGLGMGATFEEARDRIAHRSWSVWTLGVTAAETARVD
jgi:hypothetical protein